MRYIYFYNKYYTPDKIDDKYFALTNIYNVNKPSNQKIYFNTAFTPLY